LNCNSHIVTSNSSNIFQEVGIDCTPDYTPWWAQDQPSYASDPNDPNYGKCLGFIDVPDGVLCSGSYPTTKRICRCDTPSLSDRVFGTGLSGGSITTEEQFIFEHYVAPGDYGVMTHFWTTYLTDTDKGVLVRYYIDGETNASIQFTPSLAAGVGFYDPQGPWGTQWFGKGAADGGWFFNFKIPFQKSVMVSVQHLYADHGAFYIIVRGATNLPLNDIVSGVSIPSTARLTQFVTNATFDALTWIPLVNVSAGTQGVHFMHSLAVSSGNFNFLEGCYHMYTGETTEFPGVLLSTGTEDYFDSAWYFNAGEFHLPVSGFTHINQTNNGVTFSAYRFHIMDPLVFDDGFALVWRNGDALDPSGIKCNMQTGGHPAGSPTAQK